MISIFAIIVFVLLFIGWYFFRETECSLLLLLWCFFVVAIFGGNIQTNKDEKVSQRKIDYVAPYIESLPIEKREIVLIEIHTELESQNRENFISNKESLFTKQVQANYLTISYKDNNKIITITDWFNTSMNLPNDANPYLAFHHLTEELGHGVEKGMYNKTIYFPNNYRFTNTK